MNNNLTRKVGIHFDACYELHDTGAHHPESPTRYRALAAAMEDLPDSFIKFPGRTATPQEILLAHKSWYYDIVRQDVESYADHLRTGDTPICEDSLLVAAQACGAGLNAADFILCGEFDSAFCAIRPPGHHATADRGMGFCIFNNIAVLARYLQIHHAIPRIAIIDWDVHHGNGTESIFENDPDVLYISLHEEGIYPFTGKTSFNGTKLGKGTTLNLPLHRATDGAVALDLWDTSITPTIEAFKPNFLLVSAGFDARIHDPIGGLLWDDHTFAEMTRRCVALATHFSQGHIISLLEGGYNPDGLASAAIAHIKALA